MIRVLKDKILVEPIEDQTHEPYVKVGSLFVPTQIEKGPWQKARVADIGPDVPHPRQISKDQIIMFRRGEGHMFEHDDKIYVALKPHELAMTEVEADA